VFKSGEEEFDDYYNWPLKFTSKRIDLAFEIRMDAAKQEFDLIINLTHFDDLREAKAA